MNNYEIHDLAAEMAESHSAYHLAREVLKLRERITGLEAELDTLLKRHDQPRERPRDIMKDSYSDEG